MTGFLRIELVDGEKLVAMLEQLELGLKPRRTSKLMRRSSRISKKRRNERPGT